MTCAEPSIVPAQLCVINVPPCPSAIIPKLDWLYVPENVSERAAPPLSCTVSV